MDVRLSSLQLKFLLKAFQKGPSHSLYYARKANEFRPAKGSIFTQLKKNPFWKSREIEKADATFQRRPPSFSSLHEMEDIIIDRQCSQLSSTFIFRDKSRSERKNFRKLWRRLSRSRQRSVLNWVLNRNAGHWIQCLHCGQPATKSHLEACVWELPRVLNAPSHIELALSQCCSFIHLEAIVDAIVSMVGTRPGRPPD